MRELLIHQKSWKLTFKTGISVNNSHQYLCEQVENIKWILCSRKIGVKCTYLRFLMYKTLLLWTNGVKFIVSRKVSRNIFSLYTIKKRKDRKFQNILRLNISFTPSIYFINVYFDKSMQKLTTYKYL